MNELQQGKEGELFNYDFKFQFFGQYANATIADSRNKAIDTQYKMIYK